ncbi:hypothetical protein DXG03_006061, partial [Asterophora parasitica]
QLQQYQQDGEFLSEPAFEGAGSSSPTPSRSPSPLPAPHAKSYHHHSHSLEAPGSLAPPRPAPHGPRSPAQINSHAYMHSRTPSPATPIMDNQVPSNLTFENGMGNLWSRNEGSALSRSNTYDAQRTPVKPSAKALGKRRVVEEEPEHFGEEDAYEDSRAFATEDRTDSDDDKSTHEGAWPRHRP